eukprot:m.206713 g.206713  ORF g.206713 m.206713 type:complete len:166 (+) comp17109_c0_seq1:1824-2321(+)
MILQHGLPFLWYVSHSKPQLSCLPVITIPVTRQTFVVISATTCVCMSIFVLYRRRARYFTGTTLPTLASRNQLDSLSTHKFHPNMSCQADDTSGTDEETSAEGSNTTSCCICLADFEAEDVILTLPCNHGFHRACIEPWLMRRQRTCPLCKRDPFPSETTPLLAA